MVFTHDLQPEELEPLPARRGPGRPPLPRCPICQSTSVELHGDANPFKRGALHCAACGACTIAGVPR